MDHSLAKSVFEEIQARPYRVALKVDEKVDNCYFKGLELIERLGGLGYAMRGQIGEYQWDSKLFPKTVIDLIDPEIEYTHFYPEVMIDGEWRIVDPTFPTYLAKHGFNIGAWEGTKESCFSITKLYTQEESIAYQIRDSKPQVLEYFFNKGAPLWQALNKFFSNLEEDNVNDKKSPCIYR
jgi:hypothetical protein